MEKIKEKKPSYHTVLRGPFGLPNSYNELADTYSLENTANGPVFTFSDSTKYEIDPYGPDIQYNINDAKITVNRSSHNRYVLAIEGKTGNIYIDLTRSKIFN